MNPDPSETQSIVSANRLRRRALLKTTVAGGIIANSGCLGREITSEPPAAETEDNTDQKALEVGLSARNAVIKVGGGTGWVVDDGLAVSCSHVVADETVSIETFGGQTQVGTVQHRDEAIDLAVIALDTANIEPIGLSPGTVSNTDPVIKVGHPNAVGSWIVSYGHVVVLQAGKIITDVPCGPGDSGSPLLSLDGSAIGHITGSTTLVTEPVGLYKPESLVQEYTGQQHVSQANRVQTIADVLANIDSLSG